MKRLAAILLVLILVLSLCACGKKHVEEQTVPPAVEDQTDEEKQPNKPVPEVTKPEDTEEPVTDGKTAPIPAGKPTEKTDDSSSSGGGYHGGGGHHSGGGTTVKDLTITEGKNVSGGTYKDVIIAKSVGDGTVTLENVTIDGQLIIRGGGSNSIKVKNCNVGTVVMQKDTSGGGEPPRLELTDTAVETVEVKQPAILESNSVAGEAAIGEVKAAADVTVQGAATNVGKVTVNTGTENGVTLTVTDAKVKNVSAETSVTIEANEKASKIEKVEAKANVTVAENSSVKIDTITVPDDLEEGKVPEITVPAGSSVGTVKAESAASVFGGGNAIANVEASAPVEVASTAVAKVTVVNVTVNVTVTVSGNGEIEVKVDTASDVEIKATSTQNLSVSTTQTVTNNITVKQGEAPQTIHIHKWVESSRDEATCTGTGSIIYNCNEQGCTVHTKTETIPAKGHTEVLIPAVDPTCTVAGHTAGKKCAVCSTEEEIVYIVQPEPISALGHDFTGSLVGDETGHWHECPRCGETDDKNTHTYSTTDCTVAARCTKCSYQKAAGVHTWNAGTVQTAASCDTAGSMRYTCTSCSATKTETIPALGHIYGVPVFTWNGTNCTAVRTCTRNGCNHADSKVAQVSSYKLKNPTCTETGVTVYTAAVVFDGKTYSDTSSVPVDPTGHTVVKQKGQAATCEENGWKDYYKCSKCQKLFSDEKCEKEITNLGVWKTGNDGKVAALGHAYGTPSYEWKGDSCTATRICTRDATHKLTETKTATKIVTQEKTCILDELSTYTATFDNSAFATQTKTNVKTANKLGHKLTKTEAKAATCEEAGNNEYWTCSQCDKYFSNDQGTTEIGTNSWVIAAKGHTEVTDAAVAATCTETGLTEGKHCSVCNAVLLAQETVQMLEHTSVSADNAVAPTCTTDGKEADTVCSVCGETLTTGAVIPMLGHNYGTPTYTWDGDRCTATKVCANDTTHKVTETKTGEYVKDTDATCTVNEKGHYTVIFDDTQFGSASTAANGVEKADSARGHSFSTVWAHDATDHWHAATCEHTNEVSDKAAHSFGAWSDGKHTCTVCNYEATCTHTWNEGVVTTQPTCTQKGVETFTCSVCGATKTEEVDVVAHEGSKVNGKAATCEEYGWKDYYQCSVCNKYFSDLTCKNEIPDLDGWKTAGGKIEATGHNYSTMPVWNWAENHTIATATFTCTRDSSHTVSVTASNTDITHEDATNYNTEGTRTYTATVSFGDQTYQNTATETIPATPFVVGKNTYATYAEALAAAHQVGLKPTQFADIQYQVYPTIEIYGSCTVEGDLHLATATSIAVKDGGSLTVTGNLTMDESTMDGWWLDAGTLRLEQGSSFKLGEVQYTGTNGAFAMGDDKSYIELAGRAPDMGDNVYVVAVFNGNITQQNTFTMDSSYMFFNEQNSVLTVKGTLTNNAYVDNRGTIIIDGGTLTNNSTIDNESDIAKAMGVTGQINILSEGTLTNEAKGNITGGNIDAFGSTVTNAGTIRVGDNCALVIENGSTLNNTGTLTGGQGSELDDGVYIYATATKTNILNGVENVPVTKVAAVFDMSKLQAAFGDYDYIIPCGTEITGTNTVTLGNLTVPKGKLLILKETVNDGTNQYHNEFVLNGRITIEKDEQHPDGEDPHNGNLVTVGNPDVTVNGRIDARGFIAFDTLTIAEGGYVYVENEMMIVDKVLTIAEGGTLEIGSGSQMYYRGENNATIKGTLKNTVRYMNGFVKQVCSDIQGKGMTPNATLTTLVITENTILHGEHEVDTLIPIQYKDNEGNPVAPTLRVGAGGSLKFKELYTDEGGTKAQIIGLTEKEGYYTVSHIESSAVEVASATDFLAALDNPEVTDITITENITLTYADNLWDHPITKAVTVYKGVTLEVKPYTPSEDGAAEPGMKFNGLVIAANGSLKLEDGVAGFNKAVLKTSTITSSESDEMWFEYRSQVNVNGGVLDARQGKLETDNTGNIDYEVGNGQLILPEGMDDNYLITYTVDSKEELLDANKTDNHCNNILLKSHVVLTEDYTVNKALTVMNDEWRMYRLTVSSGTTLTVPENKTLYVNGELRVEGELVNNGTIVGEGFIDVMGGTLNNGGKIDLNGDIGVEKGGTVQNSGSVSKNTSFTLADYWYPNGNKEYYQWNALASDTTLNSLGDKVTIMAVAFSPEKVQAALGDGKYDMVMACGENEESTVKLKDITVPDGKILMLKDYVDAGERTIHNAYRLEKITFGQDAGIVIMGDPDIYIIGEFDINSIQVDGNPTIYGDGFVHNAEELQEALKNGGDIYLYPYDRETIKPVTFKYGDGHTEEVYETQYWIDTTDIATNTNLFKMGGEDPLAVFFENGFTVNEGVTLRFDGLNVVAAADSTVDGKVEAYNGALVVQGENGATLTNNGTIQIGSKEVWGQFAIFDESKPNKIVNNGTIESYGELIFDRNQNRNPLQFEGEDPIEYATFRGLVCDLRQGFGNLPNLEHISIKENNELDPNDLHWLYEKYPEDGQELERNEDYDAIGAFAWLIKNNIISKTPASGTNLNPWHYMTYNEVSGLFNKFATKVLGTTTDLEIATGTDLADKNPCFGKLHEALGGLSRATVTTEEAFMNALDAPYVTEIRVATDTTLHGCYYKDGRRVDGHEEYDDQNAVYLWGAGDDRNGERKVIVEPGVTLTLAEGVKMDIQQSVELWLADGDDGSNGKLILEKDSGLNVFGGLKPDNWGDEGNKYVIQKEGSYISFFPDVMDFTQRLGERLEGKIATATDAEIEAYQKQAKEWPDDERVGYFAALVEYDTFQPREEGDEENPYIVWRPYDKVQYTEAMNILENLWKALFRAETMPAGICLDDVGRPEEWLDDDRVNRLLDLFEKSVQAKESGAVMVDSIDALTAALPNGGDIYLFPFNRDDIEPTIFEYEDGYTETVYETQYRIAANTTIATNTNLIKLGGDDPMAVFFDGGFTVATNTNLQFHGLNVVAAADSTVYGRVEAHDGELVVQTQSAAWATLTISDNGVVVIGTPEEYGALAIYDKKYGENQFYSNNKIVNNGRIESYGELKFDEGQFSGNPPSTPKEEIDGDVTLTIHRVKKENDEEDRYITYKVGEEEQLHKDGDRVENVCVKGKLTIVCNPSQLSGDSFGGDIWFSNCKFEKGVEVQLAAGIGYNIRLDSCTGSFTVNAEESVKGAERTGVNFFGDLGGVTVNGLTISGTAGWQDWDYGVNVRYDECGDGQYISTVEVVNRQDDKTVSISGSDYTGKLRIGGNIDISGVTMANNSGWIELCNEVEDASIALGGNRITVNDDCGGEYHFSGSGEVYVPNQNGNARITVNGVRLDKPHVFGASKPYGIFIPVGSNTDIEVTVNESYTFTTQYKDDGGRNLTGNNEDAWIENPDDVCLTVKFGGCTVVYDKLWYKGE